MRYFLFTIALSIVSSSATAQTCCEIKRDAGQTAYNKGQYNTAILKWGEGKSCSDASCADFDALIAKAKKAQTDTNRARERKQQQEREAAAARYEQEKKAAAARAADDSFWEALKDGDIADCDKYLRKYPSGRHASDALRRKQSLAPKTNAPASTTPSITPSTTNVPDNMVQVRGDTFTMGDLFGEGGNGETPTHSVTVDNFLLGKTEVTFDEFDAFCTATGREKPSDSGWGRGQRPVINVDWYDAVEYCNWLSQKQGLSAAYSIDKNRKDPNNNNSSDTKKWTVIPNWTANGYRLPTEAEWEYAARETGKKVRFGNGKDTADPAQINFDASASYKKDYSVAGEYRQKTVPVGELSGAANSENLMSILLAPLLSGWGLSGAANSLGLWHMSGNVWEWCYDWYDAGYYGNSPSKNPTGADVGGYRVARGGSWNIGPNDCRAANRYGWGPPSQYNNVGFRVARHL